MTADGSRHIVIAGGGPAAIEGALALRRLAGDRVRITLLSERATLEYRPLWVTEPFGAAAAARYSLAGIAADRGFTFVEDALAAVDPTAHRVSMRTGAELHYGALLVAIGAGAEPAVPGALTFGRRDDIADVRTALERLHAGAPLRVAFVAPQEAAWTLPIYELALLTARWAEQRGLALEPWVVTHEDQPLGVFGAAATQSVSRLLDEAGVRLWTGAFAEAVDEGRLWLTLEGCLPVDLAVALPRPVGRRIPGLPADRLGFVGVDTLGRVAGLADVYAAGDITTRPLRQGGLATQEADAAASAIAAWAGAPVREEPFRPVLRGLLLTGERPRYLRRAMGEPGEPAADEPPWWPPHKLAARELAPYLAAHPELLARTPAPV